VIEGGHVRGWMLASRCRRQFHDGTAAPETPTALQDEKTRPPPADVRRVQRDARQVFGAGNSSAVCAFTVTSRLPPTSSTSTCSTNAVVV
jgi:hypothetical protein